MNFTRLLQYITPHRSTLLLILLLLLGDSLAALAQPWIAGQLVSVVVNGDGEIDFSAIQLVLLLWLGLIVVKSVLSFGNGYLVGTTGEKMAAGLRRRVYQHLQSDEALPPLGHVEGRITIDGKDISQYSLESIRQNVGLVAQNTLLLNGSVADNIAYGRYNASRDEIERAHYSLTLRY